MRTSNQASQLKCLFDMNTSENHLINILQSYLKKENYHIDNNDFKLQLQSNPSFPSVKSITDGLDYFGIENIAANVPKDALDQLPDFFLAILNIDGNTLLAQVQNKASKIKLFNDDGTKENLTVAAFKELWNGTIIAIEKNKTIKSKEYSFFKSPLIPLAFLMIYVVFSSILNNNIIAAVYSFLSIIGCYFSYYIVRENLGLYNQATSKICNSATNNTSCADVVNSNHGKLFGAFGLSDLSISFFVSTLFIIGFIGFDYSLFLGLSFLSIPIILYSIYSQAFIIKKWCPLCLGIASVLTIQAILIIASFTTIELDITYLVSSIFVFSSLFLFWGYFKTLITNSLSLEKVTTDFLKFKRNENMFDTLLAKETLASDIKLTDSNSVSFGNSEAKLVINAVTNPLCGHCTKSFKTYDKLLKTHGNSFKLNIIFNVPSDSLEQESSQISHRIIELYQRDVEKGYVALKEWFEQRDITVWQKKYGIPVAPADLRILEQHSHFCEVNGINYTPATIINENFFPKEYDIEDLPLFIDHLAEQKNNTVVNTTATI